MPIESEWFNDDKSILYIKYIGKWTLAEYHQNINLNSSMIRQQPHAVVCIIDFSQVGIIPDKFLSSGQHSETIVNDNNIGNILFGLTPYLKMIAQMFMKMFPKTSRGLMIASDREEAIQTAHKLLQTSKIESGGHTD